jgi:Root hair defective 3 GTP-binding protein (RHD3)
LRGRFELWAGDCLFPTPEQGKNVPMDGLSLFIDHTWEKIRTQKELNLPDQRVMVASLRCGELKEEALTLVAPKAQKLREDSEKGIISGF